MSELANQYRYLHGLLELKAGAQWKAEGSAGAEINSSAVTVVKGSVVQIN